MKFDKDILQEVSNASIGVADTYELYDDIMDVIGHITLTLKHNEHTGSGRWSQHYWMVFEHEGKFYSHSYENGSTEYQDHSSWDDEPDVIECVEVFPHEVTIIEYKSATNKRN